jgi:putative membrane protein
MSFLQDNVCAKPNERAVESTYVGGDGVKAKHFILFILLASLCPAADEPASSPDAKFVTRTAQANLAEVQMSAWAKEHALSDEVRAFASQVLDDHTKLADELRGLAPKTGATHVPDLDPKESLELDHLKTLEPNLLDRAYMRDVLKWHQREADAFKQEIDAGKSIELRTWAARTLPKIQAHIKQGEDTERAIGMEVAGATGLKNGTVALEGNDEKK